MNLIFFFHFAIMVLMVKVNGISSELPIWQTSSYFRGSSEGIITTPTGNNTVPSFSFTFLTAFDSTPEIAYGVKRYNGIYMLIKVVIDSMVKLSE